MGEEILRRLDAKPGIRAIMGRAVRRVAADEVKRAQALSAEADRRHTIARYRRWAKEQRGHDA